MVSQNVGMETMLQVLDDLMLLTRVSLGLRSRCVLVTCIGFISPGYCPISVHHILSLHHYRVWHTSGLPGSVYDIRLNLNVLLVKK